MKRVSLVNRLTLLFSVSSGFILIVLAFAIVFSINKHFELEARSDAVKKAHMAYEFLADSYNLEDGVSQAKEHIESALANHDYLLLLVFDKNGRSIFTGDAPGVLTPGIVDGLDADELYKRNVGFFSIKDKRLQLIGFVRNTDFDAEREFKIISVVDLSQHDEFMRSFKLSMAVFIFISIVISGVFGWIAARKGLEPIQLIKRYVFSVTADRLNTKIPISKVPPEIEELSLEVNEMLSRLDLSFNRLSDFSYDLAHELRTPVNNLMVQAEVILNRNRSNEEYRQALMSSMEEYERLSKTISDMLFLAKAGHGFALPNLETMSIEEIVADLVDFYSALSVEEQVFLRSEGAAEFVGDPLMMRRAISNLLSNAIRHTKAGGEIKINIGNSDEGISIEIMNTGDPIPDEDCRHLFRRFYRVSDDRFTKGHEGYGLGLAIVEAIVTAHGGEVSVSRKGEYNSFLMSFSHQAVHREPCCRKAP